MSEAPGHPDDEPWGIGFGALLASGTTDTTGGVDLLAGIPQQLGHAYQVLVHAATTAAIALVAEWELEGAPAGVTVTNTATLTPAAGGTGSALLPTLGHNLVSLTATGGDATTKFAVAGSGQRPLASSTGAGAYARAYYWSSTIGGPDTPFTVNAGVTTKIPLNHFATTDAAVFSSYPNGTAGDTDLFGSAAGLYVARMDIRWTSADFFRISTLNTSDADLPATINHAYPGNTHYNFHPQSPSGALTDLNATYDQQEVTQAFGPAQFSLGVINHDASNRAVFYGLLQLSYVPTAAIATVY